MPAMSRLFDAPVLAERERERAGNDDFGTGVNRVRFPLIQGITGTLTRAARLCEKAEVEPES